MRWAKTQSYRLYRGVFSHINSPYVYNSIVDWSLLRWNFYSYLFSLHWLFLFLDFFVPLLFFSISWFWVEVCWTLLQAMIKSLERIPAKIKCVKFNKCWCFFIEKQKSHTSEFLLWHIFKENEPHWNDKKVEKPLK